MANEVIIHVKADDGASKTLKGIKGEASGLGTKLAKVGKAAAIGLAGIGVAGFAAFKGLVEPASNLNEAINKANVTFGESAKIVSEFASTSAKNFGISKASALEYSGTLGTILNVSGLAQDKTAGMSTELVQLAADMASFNNIPIDVALEKIRSGLVGETEPLRTVGVLLSEAAVKAKGMELGLGDASGTMTDAEKVQARYAIIMEQTAKQQGDFARTSDGLANRQRILSARFADLRANIGQRLLPVAVKLSGWAVDFFDIIDNKVLPAIGALIGGFKAALNDPDVTSAGIFGVGERLGVIFATKIVPAFKQALPHIIGFGTTAVTMARDIGAFLLPALDTLADLWRNAVQPALEAVAPIAERVGRFLLEHKEILIGLAAAILLIVNPWLLVVAALVVVLAKWDEISQTFTKTIPDAINSLIAKIEGIPIIGAIFTDTFNTVKAIVETAFKLIVVHIKFALDTIKNTFAFWKAIFSGDWGRAWQAVKDQADAIWNLIKGSFGALLDGFGAILKSKVEALKTVGKHIGGAILDGLQAALGATGNVGKGFANAIIDFINDTIRKINEAIPNKISLPGPLPDINLPDNPIPTIPRLASGTSFFRGGLALLGERGPEVAALPTGTRVLNAGQMAAAMDGGPVFNITFTGPILGDERQAMQFAQLLLPELRRAI